MSKFQIVLLCFFGAFIILAVMVFALYKGGSSTAATLSVWGDLPAEDFELMLTTTTAFRPSTLTINYVEKESQNLDEEFTEALAQGVGPDLIITTQDKFLKQKS